ncbi:oligogalacturonate-specific porin [Aeromonas sp. RU39B]|uniref:oligogalacturonate-specific porin KdgM family protein n=1 Tax=Aeromonas sp. RU39B TaxID=1907416 RepID=UPI000956CCEC|nr:oligogalacturonate-specific porin KdgM family protein [Aeromonas sp. RU39B]SIR33828.1 oligogalacturonate-specific porin [Aeromonas sp. RU39B]
MKVSRIAALTLLGLLGSAATAHAATINYRHEYVPESGQHKDRMAVSHRLANGVGFGVEAKWKNAASNESYWDFFNNVTPDGSVFTLNYQYKLNDQWSFQPGVQLDGRDYQIYTRASYNITKDLNASLRYRWRVTNETADKSSSTSDKKHRDNWTFNLGYKLTPEITLGYELDYNSLDDSYYKTGVKNKNDSYTGFAGKDRTWEHNLSLGYRINKEWEPFVELGWVQVTDVENAPNHNGTNKFAPRYRVGVKYNF